MVFGCHFARLKINPFSCGIIHLSRTFAILFPVSSAVKFFFIIAFLRMGRAGGPGKNFSRAIAMHIRNNRYF